ncbi:succinylglutamate desuccinylase/aspartoacylase family protein [Parashewanella spongiae]|nr:succinylglutamate desuccinylase/aspartoacylase family protein [Parashewanella spongiae]
MNKPNKWEINVGELATGQALTIPVYQFTPENPSGPSVYIQANVHGAEVQGNAVIFELMKQLENTHLNSVVTLVPLANPMGINQKSGEFTLGRFDPITGINWNREYYDHNFDIEYWYTKNQSHNDSDLFSAFRQTLLSSCQQRLQNPWGISTGQRLATELQILGHQADIVFDLHTGPKSCKHMYCPEYAIDAAQYFSIPYVLVMPNDFAGAMDEAMFCPWWKLSELAETQGRQLDVAVNAFTLELASQERIDMNDAKIDANGILAYLSHKGVITEKVTPVKMDRYACQLENYKKFYAPTAGMIEYLAPLGEKLSVDQPLLSLLRMDQYGTKDEYQHISLDIECIPILHFASAAVHQGTELYKVMTDVFLLEHYPP